ncbi:tetratricopeptide repeat protein 23 [Osmerus mordax]|uniref:tetratricopeptide repeat protein 23 n=1 Tax=Osmerus mordax TaxID=8014 RepID=UPI00350F8E80
MRMESTYGSLGDFSFDKEVTVSRAGTSSTVDSVMITPQEKLYRFESRAQSLADAQQYDACIQDLVRCVALTRLVYGDGHLKLVQAHARLAKAYLQFKGWGAQAQEHAARASDLLPLSSPSSTSPEERLQVHSCLLSIYQTQGGAALILDSVKEAESSYKKAKRIVEELSQLSGMSKEEIMEADLEISTSLSRVFQRQGRPDEALQQCESSLEQLEGWERPGQVCSIYKDMAAIEQAQGRLDRAIEHLSKAHAIAVSQSPGDLEGAHVAHSLALALSTAQPHHNDSATKYFLESLTAYRSLLGPQDAVTLSVQDDYCRFLLLTGQQQSCGELQRASLPLKRAAFGDLSPEVAGTLQLIGGVEMTQGQVRQAHRSMRKCLEIQNVLYGSHHKTTRATQKTVDMLAQAPEVAGRQRTDGEGKTRPPFCAVLPPSS